MEQQLQMVESVNIANIEPQNTVVMNSSSNIFNLCNDSGVFQSHHLVSTNSFELNAATSLSDDSGVPLTSSSISSGDSYRVGLCKFELELVESDGEVSQFDSLDNCSDVGMSAENFNTLKKGPLAPIDPPPEFQDSPQTTLIRSKILQDYALKISKNLITTAINRWSSQSSVASKEILNELKDVVSNGKTNDNSINNLDNTYSRQIYASDSALNKHISNIYDIPNGDCFASNEIGICSENEEKCEVYAKCPSITKCVKEPRRYRQLNLTRLSEIHDYDLYYGLKMNYSAENAHQRKSSVLYSPLQHHNGNNVPTGNRPNSRNSLNSRLSSSHNSLSVPNANKADDSIFITQAMSHDALLSREISDFYNVPIDSDIYAFPIDMITPDIKNTYHRDSDKQKCRLKYSRNNKRKKRVNVAEATGIEKYGGKLKTTRSNKRHSVPENTIEPLHMTLDEVKRFYHSLYSNSSDSNDTVSNKQVKISNHLKNSSSNGHIKFTCNNSLIHQDNSTLAKTNCSKNTSNTRIKKTSSKQEVQNTSNNKFTNQNEKKFSINLNLKQKFCSIFRFRRNHHHDGSRQNLEDCNEYISGRTVNGHAAKDDKKKKFSTRALPPLPVKGTYQQADIEKKGQVKSDNNSTMHLASSIEKVKDYGWYWGPISSEAAEKILSNEPDGSFIVRDSSDDHYIFSLSFKLNNCVRHVRIEQDQGTFSFGSYAKFKSHTITEFIEKAVEHSRSGRYLFFLHRRPEHGPMRVQLTNPVSRFKHIQSLQHMCRFIILKAVVRKDLIQSLPLPRRLLDYLSYKHCYSEQVESDSSQSQMSGDGRA